jgi:hypothetical protein
VIFLLRLLLFALAEVAEVLALQLTNPEAEAEAAAELL